MENYQLLALLAAVAACGLAINRQKLQTASRSFFNASDAVRWLSRVLMHVGFAGALLLLWINHHKGGLLFIVCTSAVWLAGALALSLLLWRRAARLEENESCCQGE